MMTLLLWSRPVFAAILLTLVGAFVWTAIRTDAANGRPYQP